MLINIIHQNAEHKLLSAVEQSDQHNTVRGALHFRCSKLERKPQEEEILLTIRSSLSDKQAAIYFFYNGDLVITWNGVQKAMLDDLCRRLYAHFYLTGNEALHTYYDFNAHGEDLRLFCKHKIEELAQTRDNIVLTKPSQFYAQSYIPVLDASQEQIELFRTIAKGRKQRKQLEILVVEDQPFSSKLLIGLLEKICKAYPALNAQTALDLYLSHAPDIVFLDVELMGVNGHELATTIRQLDADAYIIMVTANNYVEDVNRAKENGAKGFIAKPYSKQKILEGVEKYIHERKLNP
jgi:two-component system chemotaxis response regulator CheY